MHQIRLENWDWIPDGQSDTPNVKGSSRKYAFDDYSDRIELSPVRNQTIQIKKKKAGLKGVTIVFVGSIGEAVQLHKIFDAKEILKKFPTAQNYSYKYSNGVQSRLNKLI